MTTNATTLFAPALAVLNTAKTTAESEYTTAMIEGRTLDQNAAHRHIVCASKHLKALEHDLNNMTQKVPSNG